MTDGSTAGATGGESATPPAGGGANSAGAGGSGPSSAGPYRGINLSSAEWGQTHLPGTYGTDYIYPTHAEIDRFVGLKMNLLRLPFRWERLQRTLGGALDATEQGRIDDFVGYATGKGAWVILDPHNFAQYTGQIIGSGTVTAENFADFWGKVAARYMTNSRVMFGLMNEPHTIDVNIWLEAANAAIEAIRATGATNLVLVPGVNWTGAWSWSSSGNETMLGVVDRGNNYAFEVHQYLDSDYSGTHPACQNDHIGVDSLLEVDSWLADTGQRALLGEFGAGPDQTCLDAMDGMLTLVESHPAQWLGWAYWAAGPWWGATSTMDIVEGQTPPQLTLLQEHL